MSKKVFLLSLLISLLYFIAVIYSFNSHLVLNTVTGAYPLAYKIDILTLLLLGARADMTSLGLFVLILISLLTGLNLSLAFKRIRGFKGSKLSIMGGSFFGVLGAGCVSCGLPVVSFFGLTGAVAYLPFRGREISFLALGLLVLSLILMLRNENKVCKIK